MVILESQGKLVNKKGVNKMPVTDRTKGNIFTVTNHAHHYFGRTFEVIGFNADKGGMRYAICEDINERGYKSSYIFYVYDLIA